MKALVIALLSATLLAAKAEASSKLIPVCQKHPKELWQFSISKGSEDREVKVLHQGEGEYDYQEFYYSFEPVHMNDDKLEDLWLGMGGCGTGGCMDGVFAACGDGKSYYPAVVPDYNDGFMLDKRNGVVIDGMKWFDFTHTSEKEGVGTLGWRYRFNGNYYSRAFLASEYKDLMKKAKAGKQFAREQLLAVAYPQLRNNPNDPDLTDIKADLLNKEFVKKVIADGHAYFDNFPPDFSKDKELVLYSLKHDAFMEKKLLPKEFFSDEAFAKVALKKSPFELNDFSEKIRANPKLVEVALMQSSSQLDFASEEIRDDRELLLTWSKKYHISSDKISARLKKDKAFVMELIRNNEENYRFADESVKADKEVAMLGLQKRPNYLYAFAPDSVKNDKEIVLMAAKAETGFVDQLPAKLQDDREFILKLVCTNQNAFSSISDKFKGDRQIATIASMKFSSYFSEVSKDLKNDRKFVLEVAKINPYIYEFLSDDFRADKEVARIVFQQVKSQWWRAPVSIKNDPEIAALAAKAPEYPSPNSEPEINKRCSR